MRQITWAIVLFMAVTWPAQGAQAIDAAAAAAEASRAAAAYLATAPFSTRSAVATAATPLATLRNAVLAGNFTSKLSNMTRSRCPHSCSSVGLKPGAWFRYNSVDRLDLCNQPMLLDLALFNPLDDPNTHVSIAACTADLQLSSHLASRTIAANTTCHSHHVNQTEVTASLQLASSGASSAAHIADVVAALDQLRAFSTLAEAPCNETIRFAYSGKAAVGVYVGSGMTNQGLIASIIEQLATQVQTDGSIAENILVQLCDKRSARYSLGVFANTNANLASVQLALQSWRNSTCITQMDKTTPAWHNVTFLAPSSLHNSSTVHKNSTAHNTTSLAVRSQSRGRKLSARGTCNTVRVVSGDSCATLAAECGITAAEFTDYNPSSTECSTLAVGEYVCCSAGTLPDNTPKPDASGNCYSYLVVTGDSCSALAATYDITIADITSYNTQTWGWTGCNNLLAGYKICLSSGSPPMPAVVANGVCGPLVKGTAAVPPGTDLSTLNKCPLNACCDIWAQCGTTTEFCTVSNSTTGAPGTAAPGQNGCISNCGTQVIVSAPPAEAYSIAYFEGFDWQRPCLRMSVDNVDTTAYTHIHFAFATINTDWSLNVTDIEPQLPFLVAMTGIKRILSIGGWAFCTDPGTYMIFREVVSTEANRATLINNVVTFLNQYDLDGVDLDWEYPDEPDIPGIPAGTTAESTNFFLLLLELRTSIAANAPGKTVSITAPASFWYLQHFPIQAIGEVVDYIVYMTYDLHGQWDYGNAFSDPGCSGGNCLRSHVNLTETINALSMITKAGVASNIITVGVSSYGRSFQMTTAGCWTEMCTYTGPASGAFPGPCTETAGYIADYELGLIIAENPTAELFWDEESYSNILTYNETQWAAYMNDSNKAVRRILYESLGFLGTSDWAVDLQSAYGDESPSSPGSSGGDIIFVNPDIWLSASPVVTALPGETLVWPPMPLSSTTTITFPPWTTTVSYSSLTTLTSTLTDGTTSTYPWYVHVSMLTVLSIPAVTTTAIPVWGVSLGTGSTGGPIYLTSSVQPSPFTIIITPVISGTTSIIGATETTTSPGTAVVWDEMTYFESTQTETLGGITTIIGGTTLAPTSITITPGPYPTTVTSTKDPKVNSHTASWTSGSPPSPTGVPWCLGCGLPCIFFCDPDCPFCPPGVFGSDTSGGDDGPSSNSDSQSRTTSSDLAEYTILFDEDFDDSFPLTLAAMADFSSLSSIQSSLLESLIGGIPIPKTPQSPGPTPTPNPIPKTPQSPGPGIPTPNPIPKTPQSPGPASPTPNPIAKTPQGGDCAFWDTGSGYLFEIYDISSWVSDGGASLHQKEDSCGALTGWGWKPASASTYALAYFYLPYFISSGCIEGAIVSAGGPTINCQYQGYLNKRLKGRRVHATAESSRLSISNEERKALESFYHPYVTMNWHA